jgi:hypothetical protein
MCHALTRTTSVIRPSRDVPEGEIQCASCSDMLLFCSAGVESNFASLQAVVDRGGRGRQNIDINLLKPSRFRLEPGWALPPADCDGVIHYDVLDPAPVWMSDEFHTAHLVFCWLSTKLAEWIGASLSEELLIPDKIEVNNILLNNVARGPHSHLRTSGGIKWE